MCHLIELSPVFLYGELNIVIQIRHHITIQLQLLLGFMEPEKPIKIDTLSRHTQYLAM